MLSLLVYSFLMYVLPVAIIYEKEIWRTKTYIDKNIKAIIKYGLPFVPTFSSLDFSIYR